MDEFRDNNGIRYMMGRNSALYMCFDNFLFLRINGKVPVRRWACINNNKKYCGAYVVTNNGILQDSHTIHNHLPHNEEITDIQAFQEMKRRVREYPYLSCERIIRDVRKEFGIDSFKSLPIKNVNSEGRLLQKYRQSLFVDLKLVDDDGKEIGNGTISDIFASDQLGNKQVAIETTTDSCPKVEINSITQRRSATVKTESRKQINSVVLATQQDVESGATPSDGSIIVNTTDPTDNVADNDFIDYHGDDFQMSDYDGDQGDVPQIIPITAPEASHQQLQGPVEPTSSVNLMQQFAKTSSGFQTLTSSPVTADMNSIPTTTIENTRKTGERCCVCGDELFYSEALACNEETFRKACSYLNVRSEREWFPRSDDGHFLPFCDFCSKEIMRIHDLYKRVEEIQTMIFKKVEGVEKRVVDAEIVDTWMNETPTSTVRRYEGFRKQVIINYCNKLKLRRQVRQGQKTGRKISEALPVINAGMYVTNPSESVANRTSGCGRIKDDQKITSIPEISTHEKLHPRRRRGRPKSRKTLDDSEQLNRSNLDCRLNSSSVNSENDVKFWLDDPKRLKLGDSVAPPHHTNQGDNLDNHFDNDSGSGVDGDEWCPIDDVDNCGGSDLDFISNDDDDDWASSNARQKKIKSKAKRSRLNKLKASTAVHTQRKPNPEPATVDNKSSLHFQAFQKEGGPTPTSTFELPDTTLRRDGRIFMQGVEIIKNPPGQYPGRNYKSCPSLSCGVCWKPFTSFWTIRMHICGHHLGMFKCSICQLQFTEPTKVERHMEKEHKNMKNIITCFVCEKPVKNEKSLRFHMWSHLSEEEKNDPKNRMMCSYCPKTFSRLYNLKQHELAHTREVPQAQSVQCQHCGKLCSSRKSLWSHEIKCGEKIFGKSDRSTHRGIGTTLPFPCPKCPRAFSTHSGFKNHRRVCIMGSKTSGGKTIHEGEGQTQEQTKAGPLYKQSQIISYPDAIGAGSSSFGSTAESKDNMLDTHVASLLSAQQPPQFVHQEVQGQFTMTMPNSTNI